ncbi:MAG TPA: stage V sporulation protein AD [Candidatus Ornithomonoglobus intestinigallinarum]|uniref:Stage V sporulation protein AD n=1 Tax=Candidatus Ornithomonoglobus intestinigallinarum TaxID=2840894 RepID=A0A9D1H415_9FIRM|nr:stage V sporulation protein AD [Candidatus Ornithomonoglobus intestinigallinarum]
MLAKLTDTGVLKHISVFAEVFCVNKRIGKQTVRLSGGAVIINACGVVGQKEGQGPLRSSFDEILTDDRLGTDSWEQAESALQKHTAILTAERAGLTPGDIDYIFAGDLLNQCIGASYGMRELKIPYFGLYGACSTMAESLALGAMTIDGGFAERVLCVTSSHFCSAEKQFRNPLEYGGQRPPSSQWTVTGAGCAILAKSGQGPKITHVTAGKIVDMGITDANNMGAAMAPAALDTLTAHFEDLNITPDYYDMILTGDLGVIGSDILVKLMAERGFDISGMHSDCGKLIFDIDAQDVHSGGSGCGCCGSVFCGHVYKLLKEKKLKRVLLMATGALMNTMTIQQGESIPAIAHAVAIE